MYYYYRDLPTAIADKISKIPGVGTPSFKKKVKMF